MFFSCSFFCVCVLLEYSDKIIYIDLDVTFYPGGMIALGAAGSSKPEHYLQLGADITNTCHQAYDRSGERGIQTYGLEFVFQWLCFTQR